ncbi:hypothetical protein E4U59_005019 [Claviceps monticola]|nr:hypothetical protein E4U59_005019 [Claviceps monticola]
MLEYFAYKKIKKNKAEKAEKAEKAAKDASASRLSDPGPIDVTDASRTKKLQRHPNHNHNHNHNHNINRSHNHDDDFDRAVLRPGDDKFLEQLINNDDTPAPPLPPRLYSRDLDWSSDSEDAAAATTTAGPSHIPATPTTTTTITSNAASLPETPLKDNHSKKQGRLAILFTRKKPPTPNSNSNSNSNSLATLSFTQFSRQRCTDHVRPLLL